jgi:hypothetical protein
MCRCSLNPARDGARRMDAPVFSRLEEVNEGQQLCVGSERRLAPGPGTRDQEPAYDLRIKTKPSPAYPAWERTQAGGSKIPVVDPASGFGRYGVIGPERETCVHAKCGEGPMVQIDK